VERERERERGSVPDNSMKADDEREERELWEWREALRHGGRH
jgi:hypothetical protein